MTVWRSASAQAEVKSTVNSAVGNRVFHALPPVAAKSNSSGTVGDSLRAVVLLELSMESDRAAIDQKQRTLVDSFVESFRSLEMMAHDFNDPAKMELVRKEVLLGANAIVAPNEGSHGGLQVTHCGVTKRCVL